MAFESIVCPEDGATGGFTKVEPDTYYCSHHKGLFRYVDPSLLTVKVEGEFCSCGNRVEYRCPLCGAGLCPECDVIEWQMGTWHPSGHPIMQPTREPRKLVVPASGFGYLELGRGDPYPVLPKHGNVIDGRIEGRRVAVSGPILYADDIIPQLTKGRAGELRHVCCSCLVAGTPATIDAIVQGRICEYPCCGAFPTGKCRCCGAAFCAPHIRQVEQRVVANIRAHGQDLVAGYDPRICVPRSESLCQMCDAERVRDVREEAIKICDSDPDLKRIKRSGPYSSQQADYDFKGSRPWRSGETIREAQKSQKAIQRAKVIGDRVQKALDAKIWELENNSKPCEKYQLFDAPTDALSFYIIIYKVVRRKD